MSAPRDNPFHAPDGVDLEYHGPYWLRLQVASKLCRALLMLILPIGGGMVSQTLWGAVRELRA